jgi:hypothetical protein
MNQDLSKYKSEALIEATCLVKVTITLMNVCVYTLHLTEELTTTQLDN